MSAQKTQRKLKKIDFHLPVEIFEDGKYFIARTPILEFSVQGKTADEARDRFVSGLGVLFEELTEMGTTDEFLTSMGWKKSDSRWKTPATSVERLPVSLPVSCMA